MTADVVAPPPPEYPPPEVGSSFTERPNDSETALDTMSMYVVPEDDMAVTKRRILGREKTELDWKALVDIIVLVVGVKKRRRVENKTLGEEKQD